MSRYLGKCAAVARITNGSLLLMLCLAAACSQQHEEHKQDTLFVSLPADSTGIHFSNNIVEDENVNPLQYENSYNGAGVAVGDMNNDGLDDIYFTSNREGNKLYLNKGNLKFEDITEKALVTGRKSWTTGVTIADVNGDGLLDMYVCHSGNLPGKERANELFINKGAGKNGIPVFAEEAAQYGLADSAFSMQAAFFDYDIDGDLDMMLLNHSPIRFNNLDAPTIQYLLNKTDSLTGLKLYRNDNNHFTDITKQSGIRNARLNFNLGIAVSDINKDGYPDVYVSNDYLAPDCLYINQHNGTFKDEIGSMLSCTSEFSMGNDIADINNDGLPDIYTLDMLPEDNRRQKLLFASDNYEFFNLNLKAGLHAQYMRNMLHVNNGNGSFSEIGQLSGVSNTDWSWAALMADFDNDGWKDIFVTNGYLRDYNNLDFLKFMGEYLRDRQGHIDKQKLLELVRKMPSSDVRNYVFRNTGGIQFANQSKAWGLDAVSNSNGATYSDLDNDGDLDLVVNNINKPAFVYRNTARDSSKSNYIRIKLQGDGANTFGIGTQIELIANGNRQFREQYLSRGFESSVSPVMVIGIGNATEVDAVTVTWPGNRKQTVMHIKANRELVLRAADAMANPSGIQNTIETVFHASATQAPAYTHQQEDINDFKRQPLLINPLSYTGPCMAKADIDGDGREDLFIGGGNGLAPAIFRQLANGQFEQVKTNSFNRLVSGNQSCAIFFDANGDGKPDLFIGAGGYNTFITQDSLLRSHLYINQGKGKFELKEMSLPPVSIGAVAAGDLNGDGFTDLFIGGRVIPGRYPETPGSFILLNDGKANFRDATSEICPAISKAGMFTAAVFADLDGDKKNELITAGEWMPLQIWATVNGKLMERTSSFLDSSLSGWWNTLSVADINGDGRPDIIAGNYGLNCQWKASPEQPVELCFKDFDENGAVDPLFCYYIQGKSYPYVGRDELLEQISMMRTRFTDYKTYADADLATIFSKEELAGAGMLTANNMKTTLWVNNGKGKLAEKELPLEAQYSPVFAIAVADFNGDGQMDLLLGGNIKSSRIKIGMNESSEGQLLLGNGKADFTYVNQQLSGLAIHGDIRSFCMFNKTLLVGLNGQPVQAFTIK